MQENKTPTRFNDNRIRNFFSSMLRKCDLEVEIYSNKKKTFMKCDDDNNINYIIEFTLYSLCCLS